MFGLGMSELILIAAIALVVVGPKKLPEIAKSFGKGYGEFRRNINDLKQSVDLQAELSDTPKKTNENDKEDYTEQYRSQWEQKLTPPASIESKPSVAKKDNEEVSG